MNSPDDRPPPKITDLLEQRVGNTVIKFSLADFGDDWPPSFRITRRGARGFDHSTTLPVQLADNLAEYAERWRQIVHVHQAAKPRGSRRPVVHDAPSRGAAPASFTRVMAADSHPTTNRVPDATSRESGGR